jgi:HK97 family phage major capsid protein
MKTVRELTAEINAKRAALAEIFEKAIRVVDGETRYNLDEKGLEDVRARNAELEALTKELENARMIESLARDVTEKSLPGQRLPLGGGGQKREERQPERKSLGEMFVSAKQYAERVRGRDVLVDLPDVDVKTLMATSVGWEPETRRTGILAEYAVRRPMVADLIPQAQTDQAAVVYMEETTFTNNTAPTAEAGAYPENALAYTERSEAIRKISAFLPVTDEQLEDVPGIQAIINNRLVLMLALAEENQLLNGDGTAPNLTGFLNKSGVQSQAKGTDTTLDAVYKAMNLVRVNAFAEPTAVIMHPSDFEEIRLAKTTDGIYIWGSPSEAGPARIWGVPLVLTTAISAGTALLGDFQLYAGIWRKRGATIKVSDSHSDYFAKGMQAIRIDERMTLTIYRPAAFCKVTGI